MKKKTLGIIIVSVLGAAAIFCSAMFTHQYLDAKNSKSAFAPIGMEHSDLELREH